MSCTRSSACAGTFVNPNLSALGILSAAALLATAARRGVDVTLIVPAKVDSFLVRYASQAFKGDLIQAGVKIAL